MEGYHEGRYENQEKLQETVSNQIEKMKSILESVDFSPESLEAKRAESIQYINTEFAKRYDSIFDETERKQIDHELQNLVKELESAKTVEEIDFYQEYLERYAENKTLNSEAANLKEIKKTN